MSNPSFPGDRRIPFVTLLALGVLGVLLSVPTVDRVAFADSPTPVLADDDDGKGDDDSEELEWKDEEGEKQYDAGMAALDKADYHAAGEAFKAAQKSGKGKTAKLMKGYRAVAVLLEGATGLIAQGQQRQALTSLESGLEKLDGLPILDRVQKLIEDLSKEIYFVIEDFERQSNRYSEKYGKSWVDDPQFVKQGKKSLKWTTTGQDAELKVEKLPDLTQYEAIAMWICFPVKGPGYELIFKGKGTSKTQVTGTTITDAFFFQSGGHRGWKRIEVPLSRFKAQGEVSWSSISDFRIQFKGNRKIELYVDDIVLVKKEGPRK
ncbi:MAG: hypothetical protein KDC38_20585 [Planctomycetes bacterium]|nr:hypothetical protein [Planctomycetota bacterium]